MQGGPGEGFLFQIFHKAILAIAVGFDILRELGGQLYFKSSIGSRGAGWARR